MQGIIGSKITDKKFRALQVVWQILKLTLSIVNIKYRPQESSGHRPKSTMSRRKVTPASDRKINATDVGDCVIRIKVSIQLQTKGARIAVRWDTFLLRAKTKEKSDMLKLNPHTVIVVMDHPRMKIVMKSSM